ncbi:Cthe_2314 family HEPN domain-containing protein [Methylophaga sp.]|uniref:Cthe_2314 family HEPN domain-containing protein n=1 Tax=Methylophaga sp. TaxID=2024840 RepID=UPI003A910D58
MHPIESLIILDDESPIRKAQYIGDTVDAKNFLDFYIYNCSKALSALTSSVRKSKLSLSMLDSEVIALVRLEDASKSSYIEYMVENCFIRIQSIYDRVLILVNRILNLGLANESISHNIMVTNDNVKIWGLDSSLKKINKSCNEFRFIRNTVIHHDRYNEEELNKLLLIIDADHRLKEAGRESSFDEKEIEAATSDYLEIKKSALDDYLEKILQNIESLYDELIPLYKYQKIKLRENV